MELDEAYLQIEDEALRPPEQPKGTEMTKKTDKAFPSLDELTAHVERLDATYSAKLRELSDHVVLLDNQLDNEMKRASVLEERLQRLEHEHEDTRELAMGSCLTLSYNADHATRLEGFIEGWPELIEMRAKIVDGARAEAVAEVIEEAPEE
ncbi:MAG: hypothetical protein HQL86_08810 [Magnetococcales bacterium]|nr:hypothetical protein [Magnetococcales bacterium]